MENWKANELVRKIDDLSMRLYNAENKLATLEEYLDKHDIRDIENKIKNLQELFDMSIKWMNIQNEINKLP